MHLAVSDSSQTGQRAGKTLHRGETLITQIRRAKRCKMLRNAVPKEGKGAVKAPPFDEKVYERILQNCKNICFSNISDLFSQNNSEPFCFPAQGKETETVFIIISDQTSGGTLIRFLYRNMNRLGQRSF